MNNTELKALINKTVPLQVGDRVRLLSGAGRGTLHGMVNGHVYPITQIKDREKKKYVLADQAFADEHELERV